MIACETQIKTGENLSPLTICPFVRKTSEAIFSDLEKARRELADGEGVSANVAMTELGARYGFI